MHIIDYLRLLFLLFFFYVWYELILWVAERMYKLKS